MVTIDRWSGKVVDIAGGGYDLEQASSMKKSGFPTEIGAFLGLGAFKASMLGIGKIPGLSPSLFNMGLPRAAAISHVLGKTASAVSSAYWPIVVAHGVYKGVATMGRLKRASARHRVYGTQAFSASEDVITQNYYRNNRARAMQAMRTSAGGFAGAWGNEAFLFHGMGA